VPFEHWGFLSVSIICGKHSLVEQFWLDLGSKRTLNSRLV
jgi:hypothetical protein